MTGNGASNRNESLEGFKAVRSEQDGNPWEDADLELVEEQLEGMVQAHEASGGLVMLLKDDTAFVGSSFPDKRGEVTEESWYMMVQAKAAVQAAVSNPTALLNVAALFYGGHQAGGDAQLSLTAQALDHLDVAHIVGAQPIRTFPRRRFFDVTEEARHLHRKLGELLGDDDLTDEKLREASETLLPQLHDLLADKAGAREEELEY